MEMMMIISKYENIANLSSATVTIILFLGLRQGTETGITQSRIPRLQVRQDLPIPNPNTGETRKLLSGATRKWHREKEIEATEAAKSGIGETGKSTKKGRKPTAPLFSREKHSFKLSRVGERLSEPPRKPATRPHDGGSHWADPLTRWMNDTPKSNCLVSS